MNISQKTEIAISVQPNILRTTIRYYIVILQATQLLAVDSNNNNSSNIILKIEQNTGFPFPYKYIIII